MGKCMMDDGELHGHQLIDAGARERTARSAALWTTYLADDRESTGGSVPLLIPMAWLGSTITKRADLPPRRTATARTTAAATKTSRPRLFGCWLVLVLFLSAPLSRRKTATTVYGYPASTCIRTWRTLRVTKTATATTTTATAARHHHQHTAKKQYGADDRPAAALFALTKDNNNDDDEQSSSSAARVRFSSSLLGGGNASGNADDGNTARVVGPIDAALSWITSDIGSIVLGATGLVLLLVGRLLLLDDEIVQDGSNLVVQTRVNLLAVLAIGAVLLNGLSELDVQTALAEQVALEGVSVDSVVFVQQQQQEEVSSLTAAQQKEISWALDSICTATPAGTAVLMVATTADDENGTTTWKPVAFRGIVPPNLALGDSSKMKLPDQTPIMDRFRTITSSSSSLTTTDATAMTAVARQESYLPTLQALPGKTEFVKFLLPSNAQAALLVPAALMRQQQQNSSSSTAAAARRAAVLLLGSNRARSFTPQHVAWCQAVAARLEQIT